MAQFYIIRSTGRGVSARIGTAKDAEARLRQLQKLYAKPLKLVYVAEVKFPKKVEKLVFDELGDKADAHSGATVATDRQIKKAIDQAVAATMAPKVDILIPLDAAYVEWMDEARKSSEFPSRLAFMRHILDLGWAEYARR